MDSDCGGNPTAIPRGDPLAHPYPVIKINGKLQRLSPGRATHGPGPLAMKIRVNASVKNHDQLRCLLNINEYKYK